jgi:uncharacterized protein YydD (DUF2326 family)
MKLSKLYSNNTKAFSPIIFNIGNGESGLNVIYAQVKKPKDAKKDSHNLGKTTLIHLLDFLLLKTVSKDNHFLLKHADLFDSFIFYLEILLNNGMCLTIKRGVSSHTRISFLQHENGGMDFSKIDDFSWDHCDVTLTKSRQLLDSYLDLKVIQPWTYRKGVSYFLRTQQDFLDYFQIAKFVKGKDIDWKPYLAKLLGFDYKVIQEKYEIDKQIEENDKLRNIKQSEVQVEESDYNKLKNRIKIRHKDIKSVTSKLDSFSFQEEESKINKELVSEIEGEISEINNAIYNLSSDIERLQLSVSSGFAFKLNEIKKIYDEAAIHFPAQLAKSYDDLVSFNKRITSERNRSIKTQIAELNEQRTLLEEAHKKLDRKRTNLLSTLRDVGTFDKYKKLQKLLAEHMASQTFLEGQLAKLDDIRTLSKNIYSLKNKARELADRILVYSEDGSPILDKISGEFHNLVNRILGLEGLLYVKQNMSGNLEFCIDVEKSGATGKVTSQSEGTSYKKLLCVLVDLSILKVYAKDDFFHFVYHDGVFEGLDNRKRLALLEVIREYTQDLGIQYILSVIEADLPRDLLNDNKINFSDDEIVVKLHDKGNSGRLFKIPEF